METLCEKCQKPIEKERLDTMAIRGKKAKYCFACNKKLVANYKRKLQRQEKDACMRSLGLTKVRGAVSGKVYWE